MAQPILNFDATDIDAVGFKFKGDEQAIMTECNGSVEVETDTVTKTKTCGGRTIKKLTKPSEMTITLSAFIPIEVFRRMYGIKHDEALNAGVYSYGKSSVGEQFALSVSINDEWQDVKKLLAFLNASVQDALTFTIDTTEDEVAMMEVTLTAQEDGLGYWYHEAFEPELVAPLTRDIWLTTLDEDALKKSASVTVPSGVAVTPADTTAQVTAQ